MQLHKINDLDDSKSIEILKKHFNSITDTNHINNYHPDQAHRPENIFYLLSKGSYSNTGCYYLVTTNDDEYVCSGGWLTYSLLENTVLLLNRAYVNIKYRGNFYLAEYILPECISQTFNYKHRYITVNKYNKYLLNGLLRPGLSSHWPTIYRKFKFLGLQTINYTEQYVFEYND